MLTSIQMVDVLGGEDDVNAIGIMFFEILLRLPVRTLLRFRCVCKEWCGLIDSRVFKDTYLALQRAMAVDDQLIVLKTGDGNPDTPLSLTCWYGDYQSLADFALEDPSTSTHNNKYFKILDDSSAEIKIINHVDGIVCLVDDPRFRSVFAKEDVRNWLDITLVNPALREIREVPIPPPEFDDVLGVISKRRVQGIGFGYVYDDSSNNSNKVEYKVVAIVTAFEERDDYFSPYKHIVIVYHLSTNSWTILQGGGGGVFDIFSRGVSSGFDMFSYQESVFSHGSLHWCTMWPFDEDDPRTIYRILAFNLASESF